MIDPRPTGRRRFRECRGKLLLQIQERGLVYISLGDLEWRSRWRDATVEDISEQERPLGTPGSHDA